MRALLVLTALLLAAATGHMVGQSQATLPPCATEDSTDCFWDAQSQGNGLGTSFIDRAGVAYYPQP